MAASYAGVPPNKTDLASALINAARNTGGSIGISLANNILFHREQFHQSRLVELVNTSTSQYRDTLKQMTDYFVAQGASLAHAQQQALAWISQQVQTQAAYLAYIDVFWALTLISAAACAEPAQGGARWAGASSLIRMLEDAQCAGNKIVSFGTRSAVSSWVCCVYVCLDFACAIAQQRDEPLPDYDE